MLAGILIVVAVTPLVVFFDRAARWRRLRLFGSAARPFRRYSPAECDRHEGVPGAGDVGSLVSGGVDGGADF